MGPARWSVQEQFQGTGPTGFGAASSGRPVLGRRLLQRRSGFVTRWARDSTVHASYAPNLHARAWGRVANLLDKHIAVLGAGAVGCVVIDTLAATGVGKITVVDPDEYASDNVFRHVLDPAYIDLTSLRR